MLPPPVVEILAGLGRVSASLVLFGTPLIALFSLRRGSARHLLAPVAVACLLVGPFMVLEFVNRRGYAEAFPLQLFGMMWLMAFCFAFIFIPTTRNLMPGRTGSVKPLVGLPGLAALFLLAWGWITLVSDQMSCFLGVPVCD
jgi:hypothetical protein